MRAIDPAIAAHLAAGKPILVEGLIRIRARNRTTGATETLALWTGAEDRTETVEGETLTWAGLGSVIEIDAVTQRQGLEVRQHRMRLSPYTPAVMAAISLYDPRLAPVSVFDWTFDPATMLPLAPPVRVLKGHIMTAPTTVDGEAGEGSVEVTIASAAWMLTRALTLKRSHEALTARAPEDGFRRYADISGAVEVAWGEIIATGPAGNLQNPDTWDRRFVSS